MFEITPEDIARLGDETLRTVLARLCEADLRRQGYSTAFVTAGGDQNEASVIDGFVPRPATGFQVKKEDMPPSAIAHEMRPGGSLRTSIEDLTEQSGAYIIVSSQGSVADTALRNRRKAMQKALHDSRFGSQLLVDFYDRTRIASWVRSHEGLIPWVRSLVGRAIPGWQSYGPWANPAEDVTAKYLMDERLRLRSTVGAIAAGVSVVRGIEIIRDELRKRNRVVRLVGLSGVGKTRFVQALFDERIGKGSLDPALAIYTNLEDGPNPDPITLASNLVAAGTKAILVIDNCPSGLHARLAEVCQQKQSKVSVITVEYDIREDTPENTEVFLLDTASPELVEKLVRQRFPDVSQIDAPTIAEFSGGNARIAIALATTVERNETIAGLTNDQLFRRLFDQRHTRDESLYLAAQACALVYSFEGTDVSSGDEAELIRIGALIGRTPDELYGSVAELQRRGLIQRRARWRAVLPHAIANRLASIGLQNIPGVRIREHLLTTERLIKSFSRRLGYLDSSREAIDIANQWLAEGGLLADVRNLNELGQAMFRNIAPVVPERVLAALERTYSHQPGGGEQHVDLLRSLAYEPALFERCTILMAGIITADTGYERSDAKETFASLFHICLSGTHANIDQRLAIIERLLESPQEQKRALGIQALKAALEAWYFQAANAFDFGARSRDFGYSPRTGEEAQSWFRAALKLVEKHACGRATISPMVRGALADKFRGLWTRAGIHQELVEISREINAACFWPEGWLAVRQTLDFDGKGMDAQQLAQLVTLEQELRPANLPQKISSIVLSRKSYAVDLDEFEDHTSDDIGTRMARTEELARNLGKAAAIEDKVLTDLLPELLSGDGKLWSFGQGLCDGASDPRQLWLRLACAFAALQEQSRKPQLMAGFLNALHQRDPALCALLLDESVDHPTLASRFPVLQVSIPIDSESVARLKRSLVLGKAPARTYAYLAAGRATDPIPPADLQDIVLRIADLPSGYEVAIEILWMRLHSDNERKQPIAPELVDTGRELLQRLRFSRNNREDYRLGMIVDNCLTGERGSITVSELCKRLKTAVSKHETSAMFHDDILSGFFRTQPLAALDGICSGNGKELARGIEILRDVEARANVLAFVPDNDLFAWCDNQPHTRYPAMAQVIPFVERSNDGPVRWTATALNLLKKAPDPAAVLRHFVTRFHPPGAWDGSLAATIEANAVLLNQLASVPSLAEAVRAEKERLNAWVKEERTREFAWAHQEERFE
jgi:hypothetical protein